MKPLSISKGVLLFAPLLWAQSACAHGIAGNRYFAGTMTFDDPAVADRLAPMQRPGTPEEMAFGCLYLGSDEASYCNGTVLVIDGGTSARQ